MLISRRLRFIRTAELLFDEPWRASEMRAQRVDLVDFVNYATPLSVGRWTTFPTRVIDLRDDPGLFAGIDKQTRYDIRRAARDGTHHEWYDCPGDAVCAAFVAAYRPLQRERRLPLATADRLSTLARAGVLRLSLTSLDGQAATWHAYVAAGGRARLLHSVEPTRPEASDGPSRQAIGRANRLHHWSDMICLRDEGVSVYDFGGWYPGREDQQLLRINEFKKEFGGTVEVRYNGQQPLSLKGKALIAMRTLSGVGAVRASLSVVSRIVRKVN